MFNVDVIKTKKLGNILKEYRIKNNFTFRYIQKFTDIDVSTLARLEEGNIKRINTLIINSLAKFYNINPLIFLDVIGYVNKNDLYEFLDIIDNNKSTSDDNLIEVFNDISFIHGNNEYLKQFVKIHNLKSDDYKAFEIDLFTFIFEPSNTLNQNQLGIFSVKDSISIAYYSSKENIVTLNDYFSNNNSMFFDSEIQIIGKIVTVIDSTFNKKN